jgi:hypothetical protein
MELALDIAQGIGIACLVGINPVLSVILVQIFAGTDWGIDFSGTDYAFLESSGILLAAIVVLLIYSMLQRRGDVRAVNQGPWAAAFAVWGIAFGALYFAGGLADHGYTAWPGLIGGAVCAAFANNVSRGFILRVAKRMDAKRLRFLAFCTGWGALVVTALVILLPPISLLVLAGLIWLFIGGRRRNNEKHAGLRTLR